MRLDKGRIQAPAIIHDDQPARHAGVLNDLLMGNTEDIGGIDRQELIGALTFLAQPENVKAAWKTVRHALEAGFSAVACAAVVNQSGKQRRDDT